MQDFDIVHFDCGLWAALRLSNENRTFTDKAHMLSYWLEEFNEAARQALTGRVDYINDLWQVSVKLPKTAHSDDVHYETKMGISALGELVINGLKYFL